MRRAVLVLLALVLVPSIAAASWYRCAYDGTTRAACCCPPRAQRPAHEAPPGASIQAASCCTVTELTTAPAERATRPVALDVHIVAPAVVVAVVPAVGRVELGSRDRPRAQGDPPTSLYARHCSLLL